MATKWVVHPVTNHLRCSWYSCIGISEKNKKKAVVHDGYFPPIPHIGDHTIVFNIRGMGIHLQAIKTLR